MLSQLVFQEKTEMERLRVQNELLSCYEAPIFSRMFSGRRNLCVLDVGCNDGSKTAECFSVDAVSCVIGLEYNPELAQKAQNRYGNEKFSFYPMDVEAKDFSRQLGAIMKEKRQEAFDVIYLSFVLMHLTDAPRLLLELRPFLKADGKLFIIEANDPGSTLEQDPNDLLGGFLEILKADRYSGNRTVGETICDTLSACGYRDVVVWHEAISAGEGEKEKKQAIFTTFFSYLPEDVGLLLEADPENEAYKAWAAWLESHYDTLRQRILGESAAISMGMKILTCTKGST